MHSDSQARSLQVYDVFSGDEPSGVVARVAAPAFPKDKVESEIATMQYIAAHTTIHTPRVYGWNSDASNPVGLEYMILEKISGVPANEVWDTLPIHRKQVMVSEAADHIFQLFRLRFATGGSLYAGPDQKTFVGPIIAIPFYRTLDGIVRFADPVDQRALEAFRAPFSEPSRYVRSVLDAELHLVQHHRQHVLDHEFDGDEARFAQGIRVLEKAVELCSLYPGDACVSAPLTTPGELFSLRMDDFSLSNIMIDETTGRITGLLDLEGATIAPLWECACLPRWLQPYDEWDAAYEGGSAEERAPLRALFLEKMQEKDAAGEWIRALERGRPFREFTHLLSFHVWVWADMEEWVDERLEWARKHGPGVAYPAI
ncbi:hypothetical protein DFH09DRAFT_1318675 [Mycena vulgaris]|nr:hypothetical protein DFH09DRAFT_1318675 [Mycena vulgaris]